MFDDASYLAHEVLGAVDAAETLRSCMPRTLQVSETGFGGVYFLVTSTACLKQRFDSLIFFANR